MMMMKITSKKALTIRGNNVWYDEQMNEWMVGMYDGDGGDGDCVRWADYSHDYFPEWWRRIPTRYGWVFNAG